MSALLPQATPNYGKPYGTDYFQPAVGGCAYPLALPNWWLSTKVFKLVFNTDLFAGDVGPWDFTDPDGDGSPGTNPVFAGLHRYLQAADIADNDYQCRLNHIALPLALQWTLGSFAGAFSIGSGNVRNPADNLFYNPVGQLSFSGSGTWGLDTGTTGAGVASVQFLWLGGTVDLSQYTNGTAGPGGTVALVDVDWWT